MNTNPFEVFDYLYEDKITTKLIADSQILNKRVSTFLIRLPRIVLSEFNVHRVMSRSVSSSRAKRFSTLAKDASYVPELFPFNHKGMQTSKFDFSCHAEFAKLIWKSARFFAIAHGYLLDKMGYSKQYTNRLIEPFAYIDYLVTASEWDNFITLRDSYNAQFEIQVPTRQIKYILTTQKPTILKEGEWHLPFITQSETYYFIEDQLAISSARCARTSYSLQEKLSELKSDKSLHDKLWLDKHMSPFEHQVKFSEYIPKLSGNLSIGIQYRKVLENNLSI
jgi:thymidylate synthase ThyX